MLFRVVNEPFLTKLQLCGALSADDRTLLRSRCNQVRAFGAGSDIIHEGERPNHVHLIVEGWACRYQMLGDGTRQITAFLIPGDFCDAHITMLGEMDHSIGSLTRSRVAFIPREAMDELLARPAIARALWWASLVDEAVLRAWIVNMGRRDAFDRIAHLVCEMYARLEAVGLASGSDFELPLTQAELGDALGLTAVHVNRVLKRLHDAGLMTARRGQIVVDDKRALQDAAGFDLGYLHRGDGLPGRA